MVTRCVIPAAILLLLVSCTDLTEYDTTFSSGVWAFSLHNLESAGNVRGISNARSLCVTSSRLLVATTKGYVESYDPVNLEQTGSLPVGNPSPSGYFYMDYSDYENSVYLIGAFGEIIELNPAMLTVTDAFSVCESPVSMEFMKEAPFFYVADFGSSRILELRAETNGICRTRTLPSSPVCLAMDESQDSMLVGTTGSPELLSVGSSGAIYRREMSGWPGIIAIEAVPDDTTLCTLFAGTNDFLAEVKRYFPPFSGGGLWDTISSVPGEIHYLDVDVGGKYAYTLSYSGDGSSVLTGYDLEDQTVTGSVSVAGYPMDLDCGAEAVYVLTVE